MILQIPGVHSAQNPSWSWDGAAVCVTDWRGGYNRPPARVLTTDLKTHLLTTIADGDFSNVSQPGACWSRIGGIVFSSDRFGDDGDQVCRRWAASPIERLTRMPGYVGYEPTWAPDGVRFAFERHFTDVEGNGKIFGGHLGSFDLTPIATAGDCRQPNWSADGKWIVYQRMDDDWRLHVVAPDGTGDRRLVLGTDATWHPDSQRILYSDEDGHLALLDLSTMRSVPVGPRSGYHGAPSISPDGKFVAAETSSSPPELRHVRRLRTFSAPIVGARPVTAIEVFPLLEAA